MIAARTTAAGGERVPDSVAAGKEWLRRIARIATPSALRLRLPSATRAANTVELVVFINARDDERNDTRLDRGISLQQPISERWRWTTGDHCLVKFRVPDATSVFPALARSDHVPFAFFSSNVTASTTSAASFGGKSYLADMSLASKDTELQLAL
jgi:hypothetical protein